MYCQSIKCYDSSHCIIQRKYYYSNKYYSNKCYYSNKYYKYYKEYYKEGKVSLLLLARHI